MKGWILTQALGLALPLIVGPLAYLITQQLKLGIAPLDAAPARVKQALVFALSFLIACAVKYAGSYLPPICAVAGDASACLTALTDPQAMQVIVSALLAYAIHAGTRKRTAA